MQVETRTFRERLAALEEICSQNKDTATRIEEKLDLRLDKMESRLSHVEHLGGIITGIFTAAGFYFQHFITKK